MLTDDARLISVDDHIVEAPHVFFDHIECRYREQAPRIVEREPGVQGWVLTEALDDVPNDEARRTAESNARSLYNFY